MQLSQLPVGALVKDTNTTYNNEVIIWQVLEHGHDGTGLTTLCSRDIITLKCFDAKEPSNSDSNRKSYGNNRYLHSNILQWLNSTGAANAWYTAQHNADQKPDSSNVYAQSGTAINPYDTEAGFLTNFSAELRNALQTVTKVTAKNTVTDGGGYESVSSKIFLLSTTEVGLANENSVAEGSIYAYYSQDNQNSRRVKKVANAAACGNYTGISAGSACFWWLRTPFSGSSNRSRFVKTGGGLDTNNAFLGGYGVVPAYAVSSSLIVSDLTDSDGCYVLQWRTNFDDPYVNGNTGAQGTISSYTYTVESTKTKKRFVNWSIAKATSAITLSASSVTLDSNHLTRSVTVSNVQGRTLSVSSSDTSVATASINGSTVTISNVNQTNGNATITITAQSPNYNTSSKTVSVSAEFLKIVTWANGSDAEIVAMLQAVDDGLINLEDYWSVGDERTVHLAGNINEDVVFVIEDLNGTTSGGTPYHAAVGQKNGLSVTRQMNSSNTNSGGYNSSAMKSFIEGDYQTALQNATTGNFWEAVKSATHKSQIYSSGLQSTTAKVILHSIFEFCSSYTYAGDETTANGFHQFSWYTTTANRIKTQGEGGSTRYVWTRSAYAYNSGAFCSVGTNGNADSYLASGSILAAPFCCI